MRTYIKLDLLTTDRVAEEFGVCRRTVINALGFITANALSNRVRARALELGGLYMTDDFIPNCEVKHTDTEMVQNFPGNVSFILSKEDGTGRITVNDRTVEAFDAVTVQGWAGILAKTQALSEGVVSSISQRQTNRAQ